MLHAPCYIDSFFPFEDRVPKYPKMRNIYLWTTCESFENLLFHQFPSLMVISRISNAVRNFITLFTKYKTYFFCVIILSLFIIILPCKEVRLYFKENKTFSVIIISPFKEISLFCLIIILSFKENKTLRLIIIPSFKKIKLSA